MSTTYRCPNCGEAFEPKFSYGIFPDGLMYVNAIHDKCGAIGACSVILNDSDRQDYEREAVRLMVDMKIFCTMDGSE